MFGFTKVLADGLSDVATAVGAGSAPATDAAAGAADAAATTVGAAGGMLGMLGSMLPMILVIVLLYFIMIRPQRKKEKELKAQIDAMKVGDKVVTIGGICGKVTKIKDNYVFIESGNVGTPDERSVLKFERSAIKTVETVHNDQ